MCPDWLFFLSVLNWAKVQNSFETSVRVKLLKENIVRGVRKERETKRQQEIQKLIKEG